MNLIGKFDQNKLSKRHRDLRDGSDGFSLIQQQTLEKFQNYCHFQEREMMFVQR